METDIQSGALPPYISKVGPAPDYDITLCSVGEKVLALLCPLRFPGRSEYHPNFRRQLQISAIPGEYHRQASGALITMRGSPPKGLILVGLQPSQWGRRMGRFQRDLTYEETVDVTEFLGICGMEWGKTPDDFRLKIGGWANDHA
jgi:hypothetical protein